MRIAGFAVLASAVAIATPAAAQDWIEYINREEMFRINLPEQPSAEDVKFHSEFHAELNAKVFRASEPTVDYTITVVDYGNTTTEYPYNFWDMHGAIDYAAWQIRSRGGEITYDRWAQVDRIRGHHLQITNDDLSRTYAAIHFNGDRLYILEAHAAPGAAPPIQFQQSLGILDENGEIVRYDVDLITRVDPVY